MPFILLLVLLLASACAPRPVVAPEAGSWAAAVDVRAAPVPLNPADPAQTTVGRLRYMGGLHLTSPDPRFGGLSGLRWHDGQLYAVSDEGDFFRLTLEEHDERLVGVREARMQRLTRLDGTLLSGKAESDVEALELAFDPAACALPPGPCHPVAMVVAFEGVNALWSYPLVDGLPRGAPTELAWAAEWRRALPHNGGVESIAGTWLLAEPLREPDGRASGRLNQPVGGGSGCTHCPGPVRDVGGTQPVPMNLPVSDAFDPTDADQAELLPGRPVIVLQRRYSPAAGNAARIVWFRPEAEHSSSSAGGLAGLELLAELLPPLTLDNFEGLAARADGGRFIYVVSDNNFSATQRTLLLKFQVID